MHSVFYTTTDGEIQRIGPLATEPEALAAAKTAARTGELDPFDQVAYLVDEKHNMYKLQHTDLA